MKKVKKLKLSELVLPAYKEFWNTKKTYVINKGSRGSGKSKNAALWHIVNLIKYPLSNLLVIRKTERTIRDSCYADLQWAINRLGLDEYFKSTISPLEITYTPTGQKILFRGLDSGFKITSITVPVGVLNWCWLEEFYEITDEDDFDIIDESIRGQLPDGHFKRITCTFNPWSDKHFSKRRFFDTQYDDVLAMTTTYKDNPFLSETDVKLFERMKEQNPRRYRTAGLGEWGISEGLVYERWEERSFSVEEVKKTDGIKTAFGLDFGYSIDPTAFVCSLIDNENMEIYVYEEMYKKKLSNQQIYKEIHKLGFAKEIIIADSAEPKSIDELKSLGLSRIRGAEKGKDSIMNGIQFIQNYKIIIHPRCVNFLTEISNYTFAKDKFGNTQNRPVDDFNHCMDAFRYSIAQHNNRKGKWIL